MDDFKDPNKKYITQPQASKKEPMPEIMIDEAIKECLISVQRIVSLIAEQTSRKTMPPRETVATLRDCLNMLMDAKEKEAEIMSNLDIEALKKIAQGN